jgi:hypothetical protein
MRDNSCPSRRTFLRRMAGGALAALPAFACRPDSLTHQLKPEDELSGELSKPVLAEDDFEYVGAFRLPRDISGHDGSYGRGLAIRTLNGHTRVITAALDGVIYEVAMPTQLGVFNTYPQASIVKVWGDLSKGHRVGQLNGLYWDPIDKRLYWSAGNLYNTLHPDDPSMGYSTLDDAGSETGTYGAWRFTGRGAKATMGGVLPVPDWFATQFTQGRRLAAGFGGYWSIVATGPAHMGPALCAFAPPPPETTKGSSLEFTNLVGYPFNAKPYTEPDRCHRDTEYHTEFDGWNPKDGIGYWSWTDYIWQGAVWIDLPEKHGIVFFPTLGRGRTWYEDSTLHAERAAHAFYVYDPNDFSRVASGQKKQWEIQPADTWDVFFDNINYPMPGWRDEPQRMITGAAFDEETRTLYVAVRLAFGTRLTLQHMVYAFRVT